MKYIVITIIACVLTYGFSDTASNLDYSVYQSALSALLNISSIIFAIIGAWIAIIYPRAIGRAFTGSGESSIHTDSEIDADTDYLSELVEIVMISAVVLMTILLIQFSHPILSPISNTPMKDAGRQLLFFAVTMMTLAQLNSIFRVILANYFFLQQLRKKNIDDKVDSLHS